MTLTHPKNGASGAASELALAPIFTLERRIPGTSLVKARYLPRSRTRSSTTS
jgi:hypothetical protein